MNFYDVWDIYVDFVGRILNSMIRNRNTTMITLLAIFYLARTGLLDSVIGGVSVVVYPQSVENCDDAKGSTASFDFGTTPCQKSVRQLLGFWPIAYSLSNADEILKDNDEVGCIEGGKGSITIKLEKPIDFKKITFKGHPRATDSNPREVIVYGSEDNSKYRALMEVVLKPTKGSQTFYYKGSDNTPVMYIKIKVVSNFGGSRTTLQRVHIAGVETTALAAV